MTTLIPKINTKNGGSTPAGAITRTINDKAQDVISVKDFGAVGDGATDDYAAIQAAINYAKTLTHGGIYFPYGNYRISQGLVCDSPIGIDCASDTLITAASNSFTTLKLVSGNWVSNLYIPSINAGAIGLHLLGASLANIYIANISGCVNGLVLEVDNTYKVCADNNVTFQAINECSQAGIKFEYNATTTSGVLMQGNQIKGNFIVSCLYGVHFDDVNNGSLPNLAWDDTEIDVFALDGANIPNSIGLLATPSFPPGRTLWKHRGFFDAFDAAIIQGIGNNNLFQLAFSQPPPYAKMQLSGVGNRIIETSGGQQGASGLTTPVALTTAGNTRASFNGGNPLQTNRFLVSFTLAAPLSPLGTATYYFYHPLMTQYGPKITVELLANAPLTVLYCVENSTPTINGPNGETPYAFQGVLRILAIDTVAAGTYSAYITVHDAPQ